MSPETSPRPITHIRKLHFLIHPGYIGDPDERDHNDPVSDHDRELAGRLLSRYIELAKSLGKDEVMLIFTHSRAGDLRGSLRRQREYALGLRRIKEILGKKVVVVSNNCDLFDGPEAAEAARTILTNRGFAFRPDDVESVAYGETLQECVIDGASNLNGQLSLKKATKILPDATDFTGQYEGSFLASYDADPRYKRGASIQRTGITFE